MLRISLKVEIEDTKARKVIVGRILFQDISSKTLQCNFWLYIQLHKVATFCSRNDDCMYTSPFKGCEADPSRNAGVQIDWHSVGQCSEI